MKSSIPRTLLNTNRAGFALTATLFALSGFSILIHSIIIPHIESVLAVRHIPTGMIQFSFFLGFFLLSPLAGYLFQKYNYLEGLRCGIAAECFGALILSIATAMHSFPMILLAMFFLGSGIAIIQVSGNPYLFLLQTREGNCEKMVIAHAFTSFGAVLAPYFGSLFLIGLIHSSDSNLQLFYLATSIIWAGMLILTYSFQFPEGKELEPNRRDLENEDGHPLKEKFVLFGVLALGVAIGVEMAISTYLIKEYAGKFLMVFWFGYFIGRAVGSQVLKNMLMEKLLFFHLLAAIGLLLPALMLSEYGAMLLVFGLGMSLSVVYPMVYYFVLDGSHSRKSEVSGYLCMAGILGVLFPMVQGFLADRLGEPYAFMVSLAGIIYLAIYARYLVNKALKHEYTLVNK